MHVCVFTDVHADERALQSILDAATRQGIKHFWCLGDFCSGGREPRQCFDIVMEYCEQVLLGNHEMFVVMHAWSANIKGGWAEAARYASEQLGVERVERLSDITSHALTAEAELVHGSLLDPTNDFLLGARSAQRNLALLRRSLLIFGHTHKPVYWLPSKNGRWAKELEIEVGVHYDLPDSLELPDSYLRRTFARPDGCLLNPGSGCDDMGARWLELEISDGKRKATWHQTNIPGHGGTPCPA